MRAIKPPRTCVRCSRQGVKIATTWPEGPICRRCHQSALRIFGTCPGCRVARLLPGLSETNEPICVGCASIPIDLRCTRCGTEDERVRTGLCARCCLADDLTEILDDGSGQIAAAMRPLYQALTSQRLARSARVWLTINPPTTQLLRDLAADRAPLKHETFTEHPEPRKVQHLRKLLTSLGMLKAYDPLIERYEDWLATKLEGMTMVPDRQLITQYARFVHLNRMRHLASKDQLKTGALLSARQSTSVAIEFLAFLGARGKVSRDCEQADVDAWLAGGPTTRSMARTFVRWAIASKNIPKLDFPYRVAQTFPRISQEERLALLRRAISETEIATHDRAAIVLMMLFGQPLTRAVAMTLGQFIDTSGEPLLIAFTQDPVQVPEPFGSVLREHLASRPNMNTATNVRSDWCFPGRNPREHGSAESLMQRLRAIGSNLLVAKNTTMQELVLQVPPALAADALGYSYQVMDIHEQRAGGRWKNYPALRDRES